VATEALTWANGNVNTRPLVDRLHGWVTTVDHKRLGIMYVAYALLFLVIGGIEAAMMRIQLIAPNQHFVSPQVFNRLFTMHGTTMIFFVMMPLLFGFANYLIPLMIGARDMAFPRVNALSFWLTAFGGLLLYFSVVGANGLYGAGNAPDVGWFAYAPLTSRTFSPGHSTDFWTLSLLVSGFGSIGTAINIIATIVCMRCPGMTLGYPRYNRILSHISHPGTLSSVICTAFNFILAFTRTSLLRGATHVYVSYQCVIGLSTRCQAGTPCESSLRSTCITIRRKVKRQCGDNKETWTRCEEVSTGREL